LEFRAGIDFAGQIGEAADSIVNEPDIHQPDKRCRYRNSLGGVLLPTFEKGVVIRRPSAEGPAARGAIDLCAVSVMQRLRDRSACFATLMILTLC
jgi:hypothetical protein